jgi:hypothetical protein
MVGDGGAWCTFDEALFPLAGSQPCAAGAAKASRANRERPGSDFISQVFRSFFI